MVIRTIRPARYSSRFAESMFICATRLTHPCIATAFSSFHPFFFFFCFVLIISQMFVRQNVSHEKQHPIVIPSINTGCNVRTIRDSQSI